MKRRMIMRLIDADALKTKAIKCETFKLYDAPVFLKAVSTKEIDRTPTIDAVEVVRCKDCKHYMPQKKSEHWENRANYCNRLVRIKVRPNDFCSYGERKDGDGNG